MSTTMTRRGVLGGALGLLAAAAVGQHPTLALAAPSSRRHPLTGQALTGPNNAYTGPFSVTESSVLSEDYFLTDLVLMDSPTDVVKPFARPGGGVDALILANGLVGHLSRTPETTSGWSYTVLPGDGTLELTGVTDLAVTTAPDGTSYALMLLTNVSGNGAGPLYIWAILGTSGGWQYETADYPYIDEGTDGLDPLQAGTDQAGTPYFYAFYTSSDEGNNGSFLLWQFTHSLSYELYDSLKGRDIQDARLLFNTSWSQSNPVGGVWTLNSKQSAEWHLQVSASTFMTDAAITRPAKNLLWLDWGDGGDAAYVLQEPDSTLIFNDGPSSDATLAALTSLVPGQVAVWYSGDLLAFALIDGDTVNVLSQFGDPEGDPQFTPPIPIANDIVSISSLATDQTQSTLFVVNVDTSLSVLAKDPVLGTWTNTPVRQASADIQKLSTWRTQLSVTDANGVPVAQTGVRITPDRAVGLWQASGNTEMDPKNPATMTTDLLGRVTFATPAVELDTAVYLVQVLDGTTASGDPISARPDADVHAYLAGTATLNDLPVLAGQSLLDATQSDGTSLFPVLTTITDPSTKQAAAAGVAAAVTQSIAAGQGAPAAAVQAFILDLTGPVPTYNSSPNPQAFRLVGSSSWWDRAKNDAESAYHGLRHGLIKIEKCTTTWAADTKNWVVNLAITIGDDVSDVISYAITDLKSALHAVCGFFQALGADIKEAYNWLRHQIADLLKATQANAAVVEGWVSQAPSILRGQLQQCENLADNFFRNLSGEYTKAVDDLQGWTEGLTFSKPVPTQGQLGAPDVTTLMNDVRHNWLLDKISAWAQGSPTFPAAPAITKLMPALVQAFTASFGNATNLVDQIWHGLENIVTDPSNVKDVGLDQLFAILKDVGVDLLTFLDAIVNALVDVAIAAVGEMDTFYHTSTDLVPFIGAILRHFGIDDTATPAHLVALVTMFPATLAYHISNSGVPLFPGGVAVTATGTTAASPSWKAGLAYSASAAQLLWTANDLMLDAAAASKTPGVKMPFIYTAVDLALPLIMAILQWPGDPDDAPPFANSFPDEDGGLVLITWIFGMCPTIVGMLSVAASDGEDPDDPTPTIAPYVLCALGIAMTITGSKYNFETGQPGAAKAAGILGNVGSITSPLLLKTLIDASNGATQGIKFVLDLVSGAGTAVCLAATN